MGVNGQMVFEVVIKIPMPLRAFMQLILVKGFERVLDCGKRKDC